MPDLSTPPAGAACANALDLSFRERAHHFTTTHTETPMFLRNAWYCAGWSSSLSQGAEALLVRRIAGESVLLYRKPDGGVVALEDHCRHRQAPLSLGRKEGDAIRCMYHGWKFGPDGRCVEIPGQARVVQQAAVRAFPVVERNDWIWVWMGDFGIGP